MLPRSYESLPHSSIARALEVVGDRWTMLIVREAFWGTRRFDDFQRTLGVARTVLTDRLGRLVEHEVMDRERYLEHPERFEYRLTEKGLDLWPVLMALRVWGDRYHRDGISETEVVHRECGGAVDDRRMCSSCGMALGPLDVHQVARSTNGVS